jgi:HSP20 family protein
MAQEKATATIEEPATKTMVDEAIASIEKLYETLTGGPPSTGDASTPIPVERDPGEFVEEGLERLVGALGQPLAATGHPWSPPMVLWEGPRDTVVCLDLPGVKRTEIEVVDEGGSITISGQRAADFERHRLQLSERPLGPFQRQIVLPRGTRAAEVSARLEDGVLELRIAKDATATAARRKIEIR